MSLDAAKIFSGPGDITLYDSTNGYKWLGYHQGISLKSNPLAHTLVDGNIRQYSINYQLSAALQQSDQDLIDALNTRRATRQTIYIAGLNNLVTLSDVFISYSPQRNDDGIHLLLLTAATQVEDNVTVAQNLLGEESKFETDSNADGLANGWEDSVASDSVTTSHLAGGGNEQRITISTTGQYLRKTVVAPFESAKRITVSAYVKNRSGVADSVYKIGFYLLNSAGSVISTHLSSEISLAADASERSSYSVMVKPSSPAVSIRAAITDSSGDSASLGIDNFQLQFGGLTVYADN